jgi:2,4-dienoyl-CoA reductase (NADPH2)
MEAARVAALRGHSVTLYEKSRQLGGLMPLAALVKGPEPENLPEMVDYLERQIRQLGVRIELGKEADGALIAATEPDAVILATGGKLTIPEVSGVDGPNVVTTPALHRRVKPFLRFVGPDALGVLTKHYLPMGKRVVVIGGGFHGCEVAEFLVKRGRKVTIVESSDTIGTAVLDFRLGLLLDWFAKKGVDLVTGATDMVIDRNGLSYTTSDGARHTVAADTIVPTSPLTPNTALFESLQGAAPELYAIGDCREPGMIVDAIADAWRVAGQL